MYEKVKLVCFIYIQPQKVEFKFVQININRSRTSLSKLDEDSFNSVKNQIHIQKVAHILGATKNKQHHRPLRNDSSCNHPWVRICIMLLDIYLF